MLSFNDKAVSFVQSSSSSGYDIQRSLSRKRNQLSNFYDMELAMCDSCGTLFADKLKSMPCPKCDDSHSKRWFSHPNGGSLPPRRCWMVSSLHPSVP